MWKLRFLFKLRGDINSNVHDDDDDDDIYEWGKVIVSLSVFEETETDRKIALIAINILINFIAGEI